MKILFVWIAKGIAILIVVALACAFTGLCCGLFIGGCAAGAKLGPHILTPRK